MKIQQHRSRKILSPQAILVIIAFMLASSSGIAASKVVAWGVSFEGQTTVPAGLSGVVAVSAGDAHCLALRNDGTVVMWGRTFVPTPSLTNVTAISAGKNHCLALRS